MKRSGFTKFFVRRGGPNAALVEARVPKLATRRRKKYDFCLRFVSFFLIGRVSQGGDAVPKS